MTEAEAPRYRLRGPAYMAPSPGGGTRLLAAGTDITYPGMPNTNMIPLNDAAEDAYKAAGIKANSMRPELSLPLHGPGGGEAGALQRQAAGFDEMIETRFRALEAQVVTLMEKLAVADGKVAVLEKEVVVLGRVQKGVKEGVEPPAPPPPAAPAAKPHHAVIPPPPPPPAKAKAT